MTADGQAGQVEVLVERGEQVDVGNACDGVGGTVQPLPTALQAEEGLARRPGRRGPNGS